MAMDVWVWILIVGLASIAVLAWAMWERRRRRRVRERFGPEYERAVERQDSTRKATAELRERERRRRRLEIRELEPEERERYLAAWERVQARFVDAPAAAVLEADELVVAVMRDRGYPMDDFEQRAADVSVDHPDVVENYRTAHAISRKCESGDADTEELRRATLAYRALFEELLRGESDTRVAAGTG